MKTLKPIPRLKPGTYTALKVLKFVQKLVKEEPKRLEMARWESAFNGRIRPTYWYGDVLAKENLPQCGTVACVAGWINIATGHRAGNAERARDFFSNPGMRALKNLGLSIGRGIDGDWLGQSKAAYELDDLFGQTHWDLQDVVMELSRIMETHKKELSQAKVVIK